MLNDLTVNTFTYDSGTSTFQNKIQIGTAKTSTTNITISDNKKMIVVSGT
jgi:hypothetical protein